MAPMENSMISQGVAGSLQPVQQASVLGLRSAMMAVLREFALHSMAEIFAFHECHRARLALKTWLNNVRHTQLKHHHAQAAAEVSRASSRLAEKHESNVAELRKEWKHARQAMLEQSPQNEMSDDELQRLRQLDKNYRCRMTEMHNSHEELQGETRSAHEEAKTKCQKNIKVMAMGVLETLANSSTQRRAKGGDWPQGDSPSVCFMQWAFTRSPEAWCPLPPARDLKHAMVLSEQRSQLASAIRHLHMATQQLPKAAMAAVASRKKWQPTEGDVIASKQRLVAARLLRKALQQILWRQLASFLRHMPFKCPPRASAPAHAVAVPRRSVVHTAPANEQGGGAFFLGEEFGDVHRSPPKSAHEIHGPRSDFKASRPKMARQLHAEDAALKIQSAERGRRARKSMKLQQTAEMSPPVASERVSVVEQPPPSHLPALPPVPSEAAKEAAATKIQAHFRGRHGRKMAHQQRKKVFSRRSALKLISAGAKPAPALQQAAAVPAVVRTVRRSVSAKRPDASLEDEPTAEEASMGHLPPVPTEEDAAATKIQSVARGQQARKRAAAAAVEHRASPREVPKRSHRQSEEFEEAEEEDLSEDLESDAEYEEARRVTHLGPALTE